MLVFYGYSSLFHVNSEGDIIVIDKYFLHAILSI